MKIVSSGKVLHTSEFHEKRRRERKKRILTVILAAVILLLAPIYLLRRERFRISFIEVDGATVTEPAEIILVADETTRGNYFWLLPKTSTLIYPRDALASAILAEIPRLKSVDTEIVDKGTLKIWVTERKPYALYCPVLSAVLSNCYFLDESGFIFDKAPAFSGDVYFIYSGGDFGIPLGKEYLSPEEFMPIPGFINNMENIGIHPKSFTYDSERYILTLPNGVEIYWKRGDNLNVIFSNLEAFLLSESVSGDPDFLNRITHLDLTIEDQVRYGFRN